MGNNMLAFPYDVYVAPIIIYFCDMYQGQGAAPI